MFDPIKTDPFKTHKLLCDDYIRYIQTILGFNNINLERNGKSVTGIWFAFPSTTF